MNWRLEWDGPGGNGSRSVRGVLAVGRGSGNDVVLTDPLASSRHATFSDQSGVVTVTDLASRNGTEVNGQTLAANTARTLSPSDEIRIGRTIFRVVATHGPAVVEPDSQTVAAAVRPVSEAQHSIRPGEKAVLRIGRGRDADIVVPDPKASRYHAELRRVGDGWQLTDLGSANGTFVNGKRIQRAEVRPQDLIQIGSYAFTVDSTSVQVAGDGRRISMDCRDLSQVVPGPDGPRAILRHVNLKIQPQEFVGILGTSGAGKTTLMLAMNGYQPATSGEVLLNGQDFYGRLESLKSIIGYVPQQDIVHSELTVRQAMTYAGRLRLPPDTTVEELQHRIQQTLAALSMDHRVDNPVRTLSGGERKRVNIGVELLTDPLLLFLDEPTSGLDPGIERQVTRLTRDLARQGRTVITVTHSSVTIPEFDKIAVMARGGTLAFFGPPTEALEFFRARDYVEMYERLNDTSGDSDFWSYRFQQMGKAEPPAVTNHGETPRGRGGPGAIRQFLTLSQRYVDLVRADLRNLVIWGLQAPALAAFIALIFSAKREMFQTGQALIDPGSDKSHFPVQDAPTILFLISLCMVCFGIINASREVVKERAIYLRERHVSLRPASYLLSKSIVLGAVAILQAAIMLLIVNSVIPFGNSVGMGLWPMIGILSLAGIAASTAGLCISAFSTREDHALTISAIVLLFQVLMAGLMPKIENLPAILQWVPNLSIQRWGFGGLSGATNIPELVREVVADNKAKVPTVTTLENTLIYQATETTVPSAIIGLSVLSAGLFLVSWGLLRWREKQVGR